MDKFVSAGGQKPAGSNGADAEQRNEALNSIRQQIEDSRARQRELAAQGPQKSLYEVLQENRGLSILPFSNNLPKKKKSYRDSLFPSFFTDLKVRACPLPSMLVS